MKKITKDICERLLDQLNRHKNHDLEIEGIKEKLLDIEEGFQSDRESLRKTVIAAKELEDKIKNVMSKNSAILEFQKNFSLFEDKIDKSISDLYNKTKTMNNNFKSRLNLLDDQGLKINTRILKLERDSTI